MSVAAPKSSKLICELLPSWPASPALRSLPSIVAPGEASADSHYPSQAAQFKVGSLHRSHLHPSPFTQFHNWFSDCRIAGTVPETVTLSTAHLPSGRVSSRMVYLKELDERGFVIYSNWGTSQKAKDVESNKHVALCFWWKATERQVRVEGVGERLSKEESYVYFKTRARGSRIGAHASQQSTVLKPQRQSVNGGFVGQGRESKDDESVVLATDGEEDDGRSELELQVKEVEKRFDGKEEIPLPDFWGGLRVIPDMIEFWQGRDSRLHDRFRYQKLGEGQGDGGGDWKIDRLSP